MAVDYITEMSYGKGSIKVPAKVLVINQSKGELNRVLIGGVLIGDLLNDNRDKDNFDHAVEMWEGEIVLIPKKKYRTHKSPGFSGSTLCDMLTCFDDEWSNGSYWEEIIFNKKRSARIGRGMEITRNPHPTASPRE